MPDTEAQTIGDPQRSRDLIRVVALIMIVGSFPVLYFCGLNVWGTVWVTHEFSRLPSLIVLMGLPTVFSVLGIITSIGLIFLREWARKATLVLATVPVSGYILLVLFPPASVIPSDSGKGTILVVGGGIVTFVLACLLVLIPISLWWLSLFTRPDVRSQFRR